jgi:glutathione S-transferase kappa 1
MLLRAAVAGGRARFSTSPAVGKKLHVDFYFDTVSPYSWCAFEVLCRYRARWDLTVAWRPVYLSGLTSAAGNRHLDNMANCPSKAAYGWMDVQTRTADFFNIPLRMKEDPFRLIGVVGSLQAQRFVTAVLARYPHHTEALLRSLWVRSWSEDADVHTPEDLAIAARAAGMEQEEVDACLVAVKSAEVKEALKQVTEEAVDRGAFGVPTLFLREEGSGLDEEMVWGSDRFEMVAHRFGRQWLGPDPDRPTNG